MAQYTKKTDANGGVRYKDGSKFVGKDNVPENVKAALDEQPEGTVLDELGDVVDPTTDTDEGSGDDDTVVNNTPPAEDDTTVDDQATDDSTEDEGAGDDGEDDEEDEAEDPATPAPAPAPKPRASRAKTEIGGMGFPAKDGKTLSIFSDVPHETVKNVGGIMVPLTNLELTGDASKGIMPKNDAEIIEKLKKLGKV